MPGILLTVAFGLLALLGIVLLRAGGAEDQRGLAASTVGLAVFGLLSLNFTVRPPRLVIDGSGVREHGGLGSRRSVPWHDISEVAIAAVAGGTARRGVFVWLVLIDPAVTMARWSAYGRLEGRFASRRFGTPFAFFSRVDEPFEVIVAELEVVAPRPVSVLDPS